LEARLQGRESKKEGGSRQKGKRPPERAEGVTERPSISSKRHIVKLDCCPVTPLHGKRRKGTFGLEASTMGVTTEKSLRTKKRQKKGEEREERLGQER